MSWEGLGEELSEEVRRRCSRIRERRRRRVSERERGRQAELRAKRIRWRGRSRSISKASRNMSERLRKMNDRAGILDKRLSRHAEESRRWHRSWDDPPRLG